VPISDKVCFLSRIPTNMNPSERMIMGEPNSMGIRKSNILSCLLQIFLLNFVEQILCLFSLQHTEDFRNVRDSQAFQFDDRVGECIDSVEKILKRLDPLVDKLHLRLAA